MSVVSRRRVVPTILAVLGLMAVTPAAAQIKIGNYPNSKAVVDGAKAGSASAVQAGLLAGGSPNARDSSGKPVLAIAAGNRDAATLALLLKSGANVNLVGSDGRTALHEAAQRGDADAIALLLRHGADTNVMDREGRTPLSLAAEAGSVPSIKALLDAKADPTRTDYSGREPLDWAKDMHRNAAAELLESHEDAQ
jgi:ankyrin repeat protein